MGNIVALSYVSLDGVAERPDQWTMEYFVPEHATFAHGQLFASDALLLGRVTYEGFAASWPNMEEQTGEFGVRMNTLPKYVVSTTLEKAEWNNSTVIRENVREEIAALKKRYDKDILVYGSMGLVDSLIEYGLLDELKLWLHPVVVGSGKKMFRDGAPLSKWTLAGTTVMASSGTIVLDYRPAAAG
ncbi:pyrimidine reductase [Actinomadura rubrobrunea]|uniref:Pyrimidine reductase n=1 Tax=Actinomadura rubrobrunea TaxID=115335 RepID=A0A9W6UW06_9ACTN|nr:dihydrofolate reductase family protein [Actinomadura rubrobrunea]GLW63782.1 pyrimidine reductase [Actinomadura rubrobrunea]